MEAEENAGVRQVTDDELRTMDAVKIVCVVAIPSVVFVGILGHNLADQFLTDLLAPLPSILAVLVQRVRANGRRGACAGLGWAIVGAAAGQGWDALFYQMMYLQATGKVESYIG